ncbi:MAG: energy transducer TonB [Pseudomonadota bacterium]
MGVYTTETNWFSRRGVFLLLLILFHVILIWGLKSGFAWKVMAVITPPIVADIINEQKDDKPPPPPPPPKLEMPPVEVPPPVVDIQITPDAPPSTAIVNVTDRPVPPKPPPPPATPGTSLKLNAKSSQPNVDEYYPPTSTRLGEEGTAKVKVCVGVNGKVTTATLADTSGFDRLDEAALKVAKLYRFNPATEGGKPVEACAALPIKFKLK